MSDSSKGTSSLSGMLKSGLDKLGLPPVGSLQSGLWASPAPVNGDLADTVVTVSRQSMAQYNPHQIQETLRLQLALKVRKARMAAPSQRRER